MRKPIIKQYPSVRGKTGKVGRTSYVLSALGLDQMTLAATRADNAGGFPAFVKLLRCGGQIENRQSQIGNSAHSHSIVAGGLELMS
ncbi:MAG: hypothetical protein ABIJ53_09575 [Verrucomicrobiota bacterium]